MTDTTSSNESAPIPAGIPGNKDVWHADAMPSPRGCLGRNATLSSVRRVFASRAEIVLGSVVGRGSFGVVYKGTWHGQTVAVRRASPTPLRPMYDGGVVRPQVKQLFDPAVHDEEAAILSVLSHRNVVGYRCECSFESQRLLVTEFVPNGTVYEVLKFGKLSLTYALLLNWLSQIAEGMNYLHSGAPFTVSGFSRNASPVHGWHKMHQTGRTP